MSKRFGMLSLFVATWLGMIASGIAGAQPAASIEGVVMTEDGSPIAGALVPYNNVAKLERDGMGRLLMGEAPISSSVRTDAGGKFSIASLPAGSYYLCASGTKPNHLRSCEWNQPSMKVELSEGQRLGGVKLLVAEGTMLVFRVRDAKGVIQDTAAGPVVDGRMPLAGGNFRIGVVCGLRYAQARFAAQDGDVREYAVAVPKDASLRVVADTSLSTRDVAGESIQTREPSFAVEVRGEGRLVVELEVEMRQAAMAQLLCPGGMAVGSARCALLLLLSLSTAVRRGPLFTLGASSMRRHLPPRALPAAPWLAVHWCRSSAQISRR